MSKVDAVVTLIERTNREKVQQLIETMEQNHTKRISIHGNDSFSVIVRETDDPNRVFSIEDLRGGLDKHRILTDHTFLQLEPYLKKFESLLIDNSLFNELKSTNAFQPNVLDFRNGKYLNQTIQGMFEIFMRTLETKEKFRNKQNEIEDLRF